MSLISCLSAKGANLNVADGSVKSRIVDRPQLGNPGAKVGLAPQGSGLRQPWTLEGVGHHRVLGCGDNDCSPRQRARPSPLRSALPPLLLRRDLQCVQKHLRNDPSHHGGKSCKHNTPRAPQIFPCVLITSVSRTSLAQDEHLTSVCQQNSSHRPSCSAPCRTS